MATTGIVQRYDTKANLELDPPRQGELVFATDTDEFGYMETIASSLVWINFNDYYKKTDFIDESVGVTDAGKPIVLNAQGLIDEDMLPINAFSLQGLFTPSGGTLVGEYPDTTGVEFGAFWGIENVDNITGYEFTAVGGDLFGDTILNGDTMFWTKSGWTINRGAVNGELYYKLDGSRPLLNDFNGGGFEIKAIADGVDLTDAVTVQQWNTKFDGLASSGLMEVEVGSGFVADTSLNVGVAPSGININSTLFNPLKMKNNTALQAWNNDYGEIKNLISRTGIDTNGGGNYNNEVVVGDSDVVTALRATSGFDPVVRKGVYGDTIDYKIHTDEDFLIGDYYTKTEVDTNTYTQAQVDNTFSTKVELTAGLATKLDNPQGADGSFYVLARNGANDGNVWALADKTYVGLDLVDNTSDINKPVSTATQTALDNKEDSLGNPTTDGYVLSSTSAGVRSWVAQSSGGGGQVDSVVAGTNCTVDSTDPVNPIINVTDMTYDDTAVTNHIANTSNPHSVTKAQVGLTNVDDTSDADKPISTATQTALDLTLLADGSRDLTGNLNIVKDTPIININNINQTNTNTDINFGNNIGGNPNLSASIALSDNNFALVKYASDGSGLRTTLSIDETAGEEGLVKVYNGASGVATPALDEHLTNKKYVDTKILTRANLSGSDTVAFHIADATLDQEAVSLIQMNTALGLKENKTVKAHFKGDGTTTTFTITGTNLASQEINVYKQGVLQVSPQAVSALTLTSVYTVTDNVSDTDINFVTAPAVDDWIYIEYKA